MCLPTVDEVERGRLVINKDTLQESQIGPPIPATQPSHGSRRTPRAPPNRNVKAAAEPFGPDRRRSQRLLNKAAIQSQLPSVASGPRTVNLPSSGQRSPKNGISAVSRPKTATTVSLKVQPDEALKVPRTQDNNETQCAQRKDVGLLSTLTSNVKYHCTQSGHKVAAPQVEVTGEAPTVPWAKPIVLHRDLPRKLQTPPRPLLPAEAEPSSRFAAASSVSPLSGDRIALAQQPLPRLVPRKRQGPDRLDSVAEKMDVTGQKTAGRRGIGHQDGPRPKKRRLPLPPPPEIPILPTSSEDENDRIRFERWDTPT